MNEIKLGDVFSFLGNDFIQKLEETKNNNFNNTCNFLTETFGIKEDIEGNDGAQILYVLSKFFEYGFYSGAEFVVDPTNKNYDLLKKLYYSKINEDKNN